MISILLATMNGDGWIVEQSGLDIISLRLIRTLISLAMQLALLSSARASVVSSD